MGGGLSGSRQKSSGSSKPVNTAEQEAIYKWMKTNIFPLAEGEDTYLSKLIRQRSEQEMAKLRGMQEQNMLSMSNVPGMSAGIMNQMGKQSYENSLAAELGQNIAQKQALQTQALEMIGNLPMNPGTEGSSKSSSWHAASWGGVVPSRPSTAGQQASSAPTTSVPINAAPAAQTPAELSGETKVTPEMYAQMKAQMAQQTPTPSGGTIPYK